MKKQLLTGCNVYCVNMVQWIRIWFTWFQQLSQSLIEKRLLNNWSIWESIKLATHKLDYPFITQCFLSTMLMTFPRAHRNSTFWLTALINLFSNTKVMHNFHSFQATSAAKNRVLWGMWSLKGHCLSMYRRTVIIITFVSK